MVITQDTSHSFINGGGLNAPAHDDLVRRITATPAWEAISTILTSNAAFRQAHEKQDLATLQPLAASWQREFDDILVFGTGGSSMGAQAVLALRADNVRPRITFAEYFSPRQLEERLSTLSPTKTGYVVISKSGSTLDVLAPFLVAQPYLSSPTQVIAITERTDNPLRRLAIARDYVCLDHDTQVGGRYSVFSNVGAILTAMGGLSVQSLRRGAAACLADTLARPESAAAVTGAALMLQAMTPAQLGIHLMMSYSPRLMPFLMWYRQLWAESIGKNGKGSTPVTAQGPVDQHSQLQLYLDGPHDKFFTVLCEDDNAGANGAPAAKVDVGEAARMGLPALGGVTLAQLVRAQCDATVQTLVNQRRPVRRLLLPALDEVALGALLMHFMIETVVCGVLMQVNPFDQPAVEEGKRLTHRLLKTASAA